jgi:hypothetical protein
MIINSIDSARSRRTRMLLDGQIEFVCPDEMRLIQRDALVGSLLAKYKARFRVRLAKEKEKEFVQLGRGNATPAAYLPKVAPAPSCKKTAKPLRTEYRAPAKFHSLQTHYMHLSERTSREVTPRKSSRAGNAQLYNITHANRESPGASFSIEGW